MISLFFVSFLVMMSGLCSLRTGSNTGFEIFIQNNGNIVVAALTKREYLTSSVASTTLHDGQWHYVTVAITPPKRPFSYSQINVYIDFVQKISATLKVQAINEVSTDTPTYAVSMYNLNIHIQIWKTLAMNNNNSRKMSLIVYFFPNSLSCIVPWVRHCRK